MTTEHEALERKQFERWAINEGYSTAFVQYSIGHDGNPVYDDARTHAAWWSWQARAALFDFGRWLATPSAQSAAEAVATCRVGENGMRIDVHATLPVGDWPLYLATPAQPPAAPSLTTPKE